MPLSSTETTIIGAVCIATMLYPIIPMIKYILALKKIQQEFINDMEEEIRQYKADPESYKAKQF